MLNAPVKGAHPAFVRPGVISAMGIVLGHFLAAVLSIESWQLGAAMVLFSGAALVAAHRRQPAFSVIFLLVFISIGAAQEAWLIAERHAGALAFAEAPVAASSYAQFSGVVRDLPARNAGGWTIQMRRGGLLECGGVSVEMPAPFALSIQDRAGSDSAGVGLVVPGDAIVALGSVIDLPEASSDEPGSWLASGGAVAALRCRQWRVDKSHTAVSSAARWVRGLAVESQRRITAVLPP